MNEMDLIEITLNNRGTDYTVITDINTANTLLNDPRAAEQYIVENGVTEVIPGSEDTNVANFKSSTDIIWSSKKPTDRDNEATECFLKIRHRLSDKFNDKKNVKTKLWTQVATELQEEGFSLGPGGGERCRQKFANLQKTYFTFVKEQLNKTGMGKKEEPIFFDLMHAILGGKDKTDPEFLLDSEVHTNLDSETSTESEMSSSTASNIKSRFKTKNTLRPQSNVTTILTCLKDELHTDREAREKQFTAIQDILREQNNQRERFLSILEQMAETKNKRKRTENDESD